MDSKNKVIQFAGSAFTIEEITKDIDRRAKNALKALENANKGKYAERVGLFHDFVINR